MDDTAHALAAAAVALYASAGHDGSAIGCVHYLLLADALGLTPAETRTACVLLLASPRATVAHIVQWDSDHNGVAVARVH